MPSANYRIESNHAVFNRLLPASSLSRTFEDPSLAVAVAAKSVTQPLGQEIRVIHVPTGEVLFRTASVPPQ
ncbi:MAG: hypothetical protein AB7I35_07345 [Ramlibacter sp.]|nr:hypothetical protein [Ramlibacter sp.]